MRHVTQQAAAARTARYRFTLSVALAAIGFVTAIGCAARGETNASDTSGSSLAADLAQASSDARGPGQDPCTYFSASEASAYVGTLATPPYRADDDHPNTRGDRCVYRGSDGRELSIRASEHGGAVAGEAMQEIPQRLGAALGAKGAPGLAATANQVMKSETTGPWDKATWIPGGSLFVTKGDASVQVDMSGASGKEDDALAIAHIAVPRIGHPLAYDGARAVALVPKPPSHPKNPCDVISRSAAASALGPLTGDPVADPDGTMCTYNVASANGARAYPVGYTWEDGDRGYNTLKHGMASVGGMLHMPASSPMDTMKMNGQMGTMVGGLMKMVTGASATTAPGASATVGLQTDTTLKGPWDQAMLMHGTQLIAVHHGVMMTIDLRSADYEHAKSLLASISRQF